MVELRQSLGQEAAREGERLAPFGARDSKGSIRCCHQSSSPRVFRDFDCVEHGQCPSWLREQSTRMEIHAPDSTPLGEWHA